MIWNSKKKKNAEIENAEAVETTKAAEQNEPAQSEQAEPAEKKEKKGQSIRRETVSALKPSIFQIPSIFRRLNPVF